MTIETDVQLLALCAKHLEERLDTTDSTLTTWTQDSVEILQNHKATLESVVDTLSVHADAMQRLSSALEKHDELHIQSQARTYAFAMILSEKGISTPEEIQRSFIKHMAYTDQEVAKFRDEDEDAN